MEGKIFVLHPEGDGGGPKGETVGVSGSQTEVNDTLPVV